MTNLQKNSFDVIFMLCDHNPPSNLTLPKSYSVEEIAVACKCATSAYKRPTDVHRWSGEAGGTKLKFISVAQIQPQLAKTSIVLAGIPRPPHNRSRAEAAATAAAT